MRLTVFYFYNDYRKVNNWRKKGFTDHRIEFVKGNYWFLVSS